MPALATGYITTNGNTTIVDSKGAPLIPTGGKQSFPGTLAFWGTFGGATVVLQAGFYDNAGVLQWQSISGASFTAAGMTNIAIRCDQLRINCASGAAQNIGYWIG